MKPEARPHPTSSTPQIGVDKFESPSWDPAARRLRAGAAHHLRPLRTTWFPVRYRSGTWFPVCGSVRGSRLSLPRSHVVLAELFYRAAPVAAGVSIWRRCLLAVPCQRDDFGCACFRPQLRSVPHCVQLAMASRRATTRHLGAITVPHVPLALSPHNVIIFPHCQVSI